MTYLSIVAECKQVKKPANKRRITDIMMRAEALTAERVKVAEEKHSQIAGSGWDGSHDGWR